QTSVATMKLFSKLFSLGLTSDPVNKEKIEKLLDSSTNMASKK
ncbi:putative 13 kda hemolymph protein b, partial [Daphnia magna]